jgi:hypothetical protein
MLGAMEHACGRMLAFDARVDRRLVIRQTPSYLRSEKATSTDARSANLTYGPPGRRVARAVDGTTFVKARCAPLALALRP